MKADGVEIKPFTRSEPTAGLHTAPASTWTAEAWRKRSCHVTQSSSYLAGKNV